MFACLEHTLQISQFNAYFATHNVERVQGHSEMIALIVWCHLHNLSTTQLRANAKQCAHCITLKIAVILCGLTVLYVQSVALSAKV